MATTEITKSLIRTVSATTPSCEDRLAFLEMVLSHAANASQKRCRDILKPWRERKRAGAPRIHTPDSDAQFLAAFNTYRAENPSLKKTAAMRAFLKDVYSANWPSDRQKQNAMVKSKLNRIPERREAPKTSQK